MSVHDFDITSGDANTGIAVRAAINAALQALASQSSGATDPSIVYPFQVRVDTSASPAVVYWRKADNSAWARVGYVTSGGVFVLDKLGDVVSKTAAYTATLNDYMILCNAAAAAWTLTLPSAASVGASKEYLIKKTDSVANAITIDPNGAETIDGAATAVLSAQNQVLVISSDGTNWIIKSTYKVASSFSVHKNGVAQTINSTQTSKVTWPTEAWDTNSNFASDRFTPTIPDKYHLIFGGYFTMLTAVTGYFEIMVYKNGAAHKSIIFHPLQSNGTVAALPPMSCIVDANGTTDYFEIYIFNNTSNHGDLHGSSNYTFFQGFKIN